MQEDLQLYVDDYGVPCVFGAFTFKAIYDAPAELEDFSMVKAHTVQHQIRYITAQATLTRGMGGTVDGLNFTVREAPLPVGDGKFSTVLLTKA